MRVLLMGSDRHAADVAEQELRNAGHEPLRCSDSDEPPFPCKGLTSGCPLDEAGDVDVALLVREHPWPRPTSYERGVSCAVRMGVPLVVAGRTMLHPYDHWTQGVVHGDHGLVEACEAAAAERFARHREAATEVFRRTLTRAGVDAEGAAVQIRRSGTGLDVELDPGAEAAIDRATGARSAVRVVQAVRHEDRRASGIDVSVRGSKE